MSENKVNQSTQLRHLFDVELRYEEGMPPVSEEGKVGEYIGSGAGTVNGDKIKGTVHWTLFEAQSETVCGSNLFGVITTDDDVKINFDTMGFFMRPDKDNPHKWVTSAAVSFDAEDERYNWLNTLLGVWQGEFDMKSYQHRYQAYAKIA